MILWLGGHSDDGFADVAPKTSGGGFNVTVCVAVAELFCASVAVHVIVVVPRGYGAASGWLSLRTPATVTLLQLSEAVGVPTETVDEHEVSVMFAGAVIVGGV